MRFANPQALNLLWLLPVIAAALHFFYQYRVALMKRFMQEHLISELAEGTSLLLYRLKAALICTAFILMVIALSRPQWGYTERPVKRHGLDIMVAIDVSKSMLTQDVAPSRLERTKLAVRDLVMKLNGSDHIGLIAFAGDAMIMCPLTYDYDGFLLSLDDLSVNSIPRGGTDIAQAIDEAINAYKGMTDSDKALVLITDGEDNEGDALDAAHRARQAGVRIFTVGVGTVNGDLIMVPDDNGGMNYLKDSNGDVVKSHLNENLLQQIAYITGGAYVHSGAAEFGLDYLYDRQLSKLKKHDAEIKEAKLYDERFQWPLTLGFILILAEMLFLNGRKLKGIVSIAAVIIFLIVCPNSFASVTSDVNKAGNLYKQKKYDDSVNLYEEALDQDNASSLVKYDLGTALYKKGDYTDAQGYLQQAEADKNIKLKTKAEYNLGNDLYQSGKSKASSDVDAAIKSMTAAVGQYEGAIKDDPQDQDAQFNEDFVKKEIERLKEQKRQQQKQQDQQNQQNQQNQQGQQSKQNNQNQQRDKQKQQQQQGQQNQQQQQQQNQQQQQEQQKQQQAAQSQQDKQKNQSSSSSEEQQSQQQIDRKQAEDLLEDYKENEEPKKLLNYMPQKIDNRPVDKDW